MSGPKIPWMMAFWLEEDFPCSDFGPVDFCAFRWFAAAFFGVTFLGIFIDLPWALGTTTAAGGERKLDFVEL